MLARGEVLLMFPEGHRQRDDAIHEFLLLQVRVHVNLHPARWAWSRLQQHGTPANAP